MARPGRKPTDPRKLDIKLEFATEQEGQRVRELGGGPWIMALIQAALSNTPEAKITAQLTADNTQLEIRIVIPRNAIPQLEIPELDRYRRRSSAS